MHFYKLQNSFLIIKYLIHLGLGAVDMFIDDSNPLNRAIHSSLGNILILSNTSIND